jgi:hypothetical protein
VGPNPRFKRLVMLSSAVEDEKHLTTYINAFTAVFRPAPAQIAKAVGGPSGIFLMVDAHPVREAPEPRARKASTRDSPKLRGHHGSPEGDISRVTSPGGGSERKCYFVPQILLHVRCSQCSQCAHIYVLIAMRLLFKSRLA